MSIAGELSVASEADRNEVLGISEDRDLYFGIDYLSSTYSSLVSGTGIKAFLYKIKGDVVAFASTTVLDEGQTLMLSAGRVKPSYQSQGLYGQFSKEVQAYFTTRRDLYPDLRTVSITTNGGNWAANSERLLRSGYRPILRRDASLILFPACNLDAVNPSFTVEALTDSDLKELLQKPKEWQHLFPENRIVMRGIKSFQPLPSNLTYLNMTNSKFYATKNTDQSSTKYQLLSNGTFFACQMGLAYFISLHGPESQEKFRDHVNTHLQRLKAMCLEGNILLILDNSAPLNHLADELKMKLRAQELEELLPFKELFLLEKSLTQDHA